MLRFMETPMRITELLPLCASLLLCSCGNSVVTGGTASTGAGGTGATGSPGSTGHAATGSNNTSASDGTSGSTVAVTGTGVATATSSTGMIDPMLCDKFCAAVGSNCFSNCHATCESYLVAPCTSQGSDLVMCMISNFDQSTCTANCDSGPLTMCRHNAPVTCMGSACAGDIPHFT